MVERARLEIVCAPIRAPWVQIPLSAPRAWRQSAARKARNRLFRAFIYALAACAGIRKKYSRFLPEYFSARLWFYSVGMLECGRDFLAAKRRPKGTDPLGFVPLSLPVLNHRKLREEHAPGLKSNRFYKKTSAAAFPSYAFDLLGKFCYNT